VYDRGITIIRRLISSDTKKVFSLALPAALKHLVDILQVLIDMLMVGTVSVSALVAVGMSIMYSGCHIIEVIHMV